MRGGARAGWMRLGLLLCVVEMILAGPSFAAAAEPPLLRQFCPTGHAAEQCEIVLGLATDPASGDLYVADGNNMRVNKFTAYGQFTSTWGWGVVASGPHNEPRSEIQKVTVDASGGSFSLSFPGIGGGESTAPIAFNTSAASVQAALEGISELNPGDVSVSGPAGGPWSVEFTGSRGDEYLPALGIVSSTLSGGSATATVTIVRPGANFEICTPAGGDVCREGQGYFGGSFGSGSEAGQLAAPQGVGVNSAGEVYVFDGQNNRVQKFSPDGEFMLMFGGEVDKTTGADVCTAASGDHCGIGVEGTGAGFFIKGLGGSFLAIAPDDTVYVGDKERIEAFDAEGGFEGQISGGALAGRTVQSLAIEPGGNFYAAFFGQEDVLELSPAGGELCTLKVANPTALATDAGGNVYVASHAGLVLGVTTVFRFNSACGGKETLFEEPGEDSTGGVSSFGLATSSPPTCGLTGVDLFFGSASQRNTFIRLYGAPPDIDVCPPPRVPPTISAQHALSVDTDGALLRAKINPHFWPDTAYYVEYGTGKCSEGGCEETALFPGSALGAGTTGQDVTTKGIFLGDLLPDTTYHYRFVAESELSEAGPAIGEGEAQAEGTFHTFAPAPAAKGDCPNQQFRGGASSHLPDCRAYEMVSPVEKNADVSVPSDATHDLAAANGDSFTYATLAAAYGDPLSAPLIPQYFSVREAGPGAGWSTRSIVPPRKLPLLYTASATLEAEYKAFSEDLCSAWVVQDTDVALAPGAPEGVPNLYRRDNCGEGEGEYELISTVAPTKPAPGFSEETEPENSTYFFEVQGTSADGSLTVFRAPAQLTANAANAELRQIYAYEEGQLFAIDILPSGNPAQTHASVGTSQGFVANFTEDSVYQAVSEDGSRVFWSASGDPVGGKIPTRSAGGTAARGEQQGPLFVRIDPTLPPSKKCEAGKACTLLVSPAQTTRFVGAAADGSVATYSVVGEEGEELFEFDVSKALAGEASKTPIAKGVQGVMGQSKDASKVYLASSEVLSGEEENSEGDSAKAGQPNLYLYQRGLGFTFVGTLAGADTDRIRMTRTFSPVNPKPFLRSSRVSSDGLHAAFTSRAPLTGYDNTDAESGEADSEVFLYDASANDGAGEIVCASCNPSGARPSGVNVGEDDPGRSFWASGRLPGWVDQFHPGRFLSEDGRRLFFESFSSLVPRDTNGRQDVYEWERVTGREECEEEIGGELFVADSSGCLSLISSGEGAGDAELADVSADGRDVFFGTPASLSAKDPGLYDIYDAREGGGEALAVPPPGCEGEACQGTPEAPNDPTPASSSFEGAGNVREEAAPVRRPCGKGKVRRKGRCVVKRHHRKASHRRRAKR